LRWRASDGAVVCGHERRGLESRPTLEEALRVIDAFRGERPTVRGDGLQFFVVLDLKDENEAFHRALVKALDAQGERLASSRTPRSHPAPITVLVTGFRAALERSIPRERLDARCLIEGRDYGGRIEALGGPARFQWIALDYPIDRERVRAIHEGRDPRARGRFNVRIVAAGRNLAAAIRAGADAVNADLDEISAAVRLAAPPRPSSARSRREGSPAP